VALKIKLGLARSIAGQDPAKTQSVLSELIQEAGEALENLRELARGIYPPILADSGLQVALEAHHGRLPLPVKLAVKNMRRYAPDVEAAAYFCILEALQNVVKHANASGATVTLEERDGRLFFSVCDDGRGLEPAAAAKGTGMQNMSDRLQALGGEFQVRLGEKGGAAVGGSLPVRVAAPLVRA
jgi:signal transduction histidine kinase